MNNLRHHRLLTPVLLTAALSFSSFVSYADTSNILPPPPDNDTTTNQTTDANSSQTGSSPTSSTSDTSSPDTESMSQHPSMPDTSTSGSPSSTDTATTPDTTSTPTGTPSATDSTPADPTSPTSAPAGATPDSVTPAPTPSNKPDMAPPAQPSQAATTAMPPKGPVNCQYHIPAEAKSVDQSLISAWAKSAAVQSFTFTPASLNTQLDELKACYTESGWQSFSDALQKSGNLDAIRTQQLTVSSQLTGMPKVDTAESNQWSVTVPMEVVYQNAKEKLTQMLDVKLTIGRKTTGDLGIMQLIATPRKNASTSMSGSTPSPTGPVSTPASSPSPTGPVSTPTSH